VAAIAICRQLAARVGNHPESARLVVPVVSRPPPASAGCGDRRSDRRRRAGEKHATMHSHVRHPRVPHTPAVRPSPAVLPGHAHPREEAPIAEYALPADGETQGGPQMQNCRFWRFLAACPVLC
jgi:hypothetical protein